jgi:hypothetical protein
MARNPLTADAFALSPIAAQPTLPSEADFEAIRDAFMETARGRWFLAEYASRNRNVDTAMVLDAVARIEASVAARERTSPSAVAVIAQIRPLIAEARAASDAALTSPDWVETVAAGRRGARIIREISWSLRETGTDPRICNILDAQLLAFETINDLGSDGLPRELIGEVFDDLILKLEEIGGDSRSAQRETTEPVETIGANLDAAEAAAIIEAPSVFTSAAPVFAAPAFVMPEVLAEAGHQPTGIQETDVQEAESHEPGPTSDEMAADDAVLDLIAMEMSAPAIEDVDDFDGDDALSELRSLAETAPQPSPIMQVPEMAVPAIAAPMTSTVASPSDSLGASLIASGVVRMPRMASEALAAFRRMSQTEKVAFFS